MRDLILTLRDYDVETGGVAGRAADEIARLRAEVEVAKDQAQRRREWFAWCQRELGPIFSGGTHHDDNARAYIERLRAEVERRTRERDEAKACPMILCPYETRAESAEARVAELEAFVADLIDAGLRCDLAPTRLQSGLCQSNCDDFYTRYLRREDAAIRARARALLSPQPAPCGTCGGSGQVNRWFEIGREWRLCRCPDCRGEGK